MGSVFSCRGSCGERWGGYLGPWMGVGGEQGATCLGGGWNFTNKVSSRFEGAMGEMLLGVLLNSLGS